MTDYIKAILETIKKVEEIIGYQERPSSSRIKKELNLWFAEKIKEEGRK